MKVGPRSGRPQDLERDRRFLFFLLPAGIILTLAHRLEADEGQVLNGAWNLFNGRRIYDDFFEFVGPGSFEWVGLFFKVLGPSYWTAMLASWILLLVSLWAFHDLANRSIPHRGAARGASLVWLLAAASPPFVNHNSFSSFLAVFFCLLILGTAGGEGQPEGPVSKGWAAFLAGALASLTFFVLQPKGLVLLLLGLGSLLLSGRVALYLTGAAAAGLLGFLRWGLNPVSAVLTVARGAAEMNHLTLSYLPLLGALGLVALVAWASHREGLLDRKGVILLLLQLGLWASIAHLPDPWHLWINAFPLILMVGRLAARALGRGPSQAWRRSVRVLFAVVALGGALRLITQNVAETRWAEVWIREVGGLLGDADFFAYTFLPSFYLELGVANPYFNSVLYTGAHPADHFRRNVDILAERRPRFILLDYTSVEKYGHSLENPVDEFIRRHYRRLWILPHSRGALEIWEWAGDAEAEILADARTAA
jgi:hypothetical protein